MSRFPSVTGIKLIKALGTCGFEVVRVQGSHHFLRHSDGRCTVVPVHRGETIGRGLLAQILRDCELFGLDAGLFHLTNLLLHTANAVLLLLVLSAMTGRVWSSRCCRPQPRRSFLRPAGGHILRWAGCGTSARSCR